MAAGLCELIVAFIRTEIIAGFELMLWLEIKNTDFYLLLWNNDFVRPAMASGLISIPIISAIDEYKQNKININQILRKFKR